MSSDALSYDQNELLIALIDAWQSMPKEERTIFRTFAYDGTYHRPLVMLLRSPFKIQVLLADLEALADAGLIRARQLPQRSLEFSLTNDAFRYHARLVEQAGGIGNEIESAVSQLVNSEYAAVRFPTVRVQLGNAQAALMSENVEEELTNIGHYCRQALQAYAEELSKEFPPEIPELSPAKTFNRLSGVLDAIRPRLGDSEAELLKALLAYWKAATGLVQRQVHGTQGDEPPLTIEDARRAVFHTFLVIYEFERSLNRLRSG